MQINLLIGGYAGQGINLVSKIVSSTMVSWGYFTFNYRDYQSLIRGGHNFNVLSISNKPLESHSSKMDVIVALDKRTIKTHEHALVKGGSLITWEEFPNEGRNINIALAGKLIKILGIPLNVLEEQISSMFKDESEALISAKKGYESGKDLFHLQKLDNNITIMSGSEAMAVAAKNSDLDVYIGYPMTPSTNALHAIAELQKNNRILAFQPEGEIAGISMALGASFSGAKTMVGTSGGGFDLMSESLSMQGMSKIPLTVYLAMRSGPATGVPTYTAQADLGIALKAGHGEFPRVVVAPGNPIECVEKTSEALFLAEKFTCLSIILSDKHLAESEFSSTLFPKSSPKIKISRRLPGEKNLIRSSSYEADNHGNTTESYVLTEANANERLARYKEIKEYVKDNFEMIKIHGKLDSDTLIVGWGSTSGAIKDAINSGEIEAKFLQIMYMKPMSDVVKKEIEKAKKVILIELNSTGQLGRLIREHTGIKIDNRLLKYNGRPFHTDELIKHLKAMI